MYLISGTFSESPQRTHRWNNLRLTLEQLAGLKENLMVRVNGKGGAIPWFWIPFFHAPILGGWREYVVLAPTEPYAFWRIGWKHAAGGGVTRLFLHGHVRMLIGPEDVSFFGLNEHGDQLPLAQIGVGRIGRGGRFIKVPLL